MQSSAPTFTTESVLVFDLDNTLYPSNRDIFSQVSDLIGKYVAQTLGLPANEAYVVQKDYFRRYGTTLRGLMSEHEIDPADYLAKVHDIDLSVIAPAPDLEVALRNIPARKVIFTNASRDHADRVMNRLGIADHFESIFDIVDANYIPKPMQEPYDAILARENIDPTKAIYFEDMAKNLLPAKDMGMTTVLIETQADWAQDGSDDPRIDFKTNDLTGFLQSMTSL